MEGFGKGWRTWGRGRREGVGVGWGVGGGVCGFEVLLCGMTSVHVSVV
jgi:hypothetical protein